MGVEINGKELKRTLRRILAIALFSVCALILMAIVVFVPVISIASILTAVAFVITLPLHLILWFCGRRGFFVRYGGKTSWMMRGAFDRR